MSARSNDKTRPSLRDEARSSHRPGALAAGLVLALTACTGVVAVPSSSRPVTTTPPTVTTVAAAPSTTAAAPGCGREGGFVDGGRVLQLDQDSSDTATLGLISWRVFDGCESFTVRFETPEGAPATTPPRTLVEFLESRQVLRIATEAESTVTTDQLVESPLVDSFFVVRSLDGGLFIDLHLSHPAQARAEVTSSPAQLTIELESGVQPFDSSAVIAPNVVVTSPRDGLEVAAGASVEVTGYARVDQGNVLVRGLLGNSTAVEGSATAADWSETWGQFATSLQLPPGEVTLFVGEEDPEDGALVGAELSLTVR